MFSILFLLCVYPFYCKIDVATIVDSYLQLENVRRKNEIGQGFASSIKVFVALQQTPLQAALDPYSVNDVDYRSIHDDFCRVCALSLERRERNRQSRASKRYTTVLRRTISH